MAAESEGWSNGCFLPLVLCSEGEILWKWNDKSSEIIAGRSILLSPPCP